MSTMTTSSSKLPNELSGFGFPEAPRAVEICTEEDCNRDNRPLPTDLYCGKHGRFLPLIRWHSAARVFAAVLSSLAIYGSFEAAVQFNSQLPIFLAYSATCLGLVALPLRHFIRTAVITSLIWILASAAPIVYRITGSNFHVIMIAAILVVGIAVFALYVIANTPRAKLPQSLNRESRVISRLVAAAFIVAAGSAGTSFALHVEGYFLPGDEPQALRVGLVISVISLGLGVLLISASSVVIGVRSMKLNVRTLPKPRRPTWIRTRLLPRTSRRHRGRNPLDRAAEVLAWAIYQVARSFANALIVMGRVTANCLALAAYVLAYVIVTFTNLILRVAVLTARWVQATAVSAAKLTFYAISIACRCLLDVVASVIVPICVLVGAPWLVMASASETLSYLLHGSLGALRDLSVIGLVVMALLLSSWAILANQHPRESLESFERSAETTFAYGLIILLAGGLLLGVPGTFFGYGHIRIGRVTLSACGLAVAALLYYAIRRLFGSKSNAQPAQSPAAPNSSPSPGTNGRGWVIAVAVLVIVGASAGLIAWAPWSNLQISQPTGLTADIRTTTTVAISWSAPSSGPLPSRYVIIENGRAIGTVPGTVTSYHAARLVPDVPYRFQVIAVGGDHSLRSSVMTAYTRAPRLFMAVLTGQWTVFYSNITWNGFTPASTLTTDTWTFTPGCATSQCPVAVTGALGGNQFTATLRQYAGVYTSKATDTTYFSCGSSPSPSNLILRIKILKGEEAGGRWIASSWIGTMSLSVPAGDCNAANIASTIKASH
jgi:hypothetical protein